MDPSGCLSQDKPILLLEGVGMYDSEERFSDVKQ